MHTQAINIVDEGNLTQVSYREKGIGKIGKIEARVSRQIGRRLRSADGQWVSRSRRPGVVLCPLWAGGAQLRFEGDEVVPTWIMTGTVFDRMNNAREKARRTVDGNPGPRISFSRVLRLLAAGETALVGLSEIKLGPGRFALSHVLSLPFLPLLSSRSLPKSVFGEDI
jgi:hypothetical protein